ncbi:uncharacterized protein LOC127510033 [Ctenopharyngodon idella]|uniref:uncharacterized protein LOC127510033 n=1 Tax=Ctenopharyngodon idella TaxID=7959 RepID=UPI0022319FDF|nr:uncharacterized protein LOC127510033 [Ctenopharyngodon idella]
MIKAFGKRPRDMDNAFIWFFVCLWRLVDVTDEMKSVSVMEGDSVTLNTDITEVLKYLSIQWMFRSTRIAEVSRLTQTNLTYVGPDGRMRDRLKLDQTGSLTITNTRTTDSGLYKLSLISRETKYKSFNVTVYESPQSTSSPERSSTSNFLSSCCAVSNLSFTQTEDASITELHQPSSDLIHCCGFIETVIRLALSALVGVATVAFLVYDIRSTRSELNRTEESRSHRQTISVK